MKYLGSCLILAFVASCGITEYKHVDYSSPENSQDGTSFSQPCRILSVAYDSEIKGFVDSSCSSCHVQGGSAGSVFAFVDGDDDANTQIFLNLLSGDSNAIFQKLSGGTSHGGGAILSSQDQEKIDTFFQAKDLCLPDSLE
ncbi:hypothetical protein [Pseudobacteriovorax antillogorgiicola]|uniref:Cytochrome c domain-containing protein n=1 Tax=Pseudobacteriovorax antillogorgiicola TaxID=1513793 RepID=A0A1Y6BK74_9BACT|nr:hypothetical protein [Pseudobacteriovorax antillogorgiicola]TCS56282.1 hypothetical protein EDD56_104104 [Pseudobacteriovorax antillogorgiicola]SMF07653.1 hypothetical protein SAMN06296036_104229 [Pseudobacteriovorax antillogorgiicola]